MEFADPLARKARALFGTHCRCSVVKQDLLVVGVHQLPSARSNDLVKVCSQGSFPISFGQINRQAVNELLGFGRQGLSLGRVRQQRLQSARICEDQCPYHLGVTDGDAENEAETEVEGEGVRVSETEEVSLGVTDVEDVGVKSGTTVMPSANLQTGAEYSQHDHSTHLH